MREINAFAAEIGKFMLNHIEIPMTMIMKIKIQNPDRLVEIYKEVAPNWVMKFRGGSGDESDVYKFGLQSDKSKVWDEFQVHIGKKTKIMYNTETFTPYHYVILAMNDTNSNSMKKEITKQILLEEFKNPILPLFVCIRLVVSSVSVI